MCDYRHNWSQRRRVKGKDQVRSVFTVCLTQEDGGQYCSIVVSIESVMNSGKLGQMSVANGICVYIQLFRFTFNFSCLHSILKANPIVPPCLRPAQVPLPSNMVSLRLALFMGCSLSSPCDIFFFLMPRANLFWLALCTPVEEVSVPDSVRELCEGCFKGCRSLRRVTFGPSSSLQQRYCGY